MAVTTTNGDGYALYNGVKLPNIDTVWTDKETYPYGIVVYGEDFGFTFGAFLFSSQPFVLENDAINPSDGSKCPNYMYDPTGTMTGNASNSWQFLGEETANATPDRTIWTSHEILNEDGTVYLAASDPIPLDGYTVIEWDGNTEGLTEIYVPDNIVYRVSNDYLDISSLDDVEFVVQTYGGALLTKADAVGGSFNIGSDSDYKYWHFSSNDNAIAGSVFWYDYPDESGFGLGNQGVMYIRLFAYRTTEAPSTTFDKTAFLSGLAMGLTGKGDPTSGMSVSGSGTDAFTKGYLTGAALRRKRIIPEATPSANGDVYGVSWTVGASPLMTRTDAAAALADPIPSVGGSAGSSPFDSIYPWSEMKVVEDANGLGSFVAIPKFYYKWTHNGTSIQLQITDSPADGFSVSPAHMDRGDGKGERDVVYIARYKSAGANGYSISGAAPMVNMTRAQFREAASAGAALGVSLQDYAMLWTTRMLMIVEYATWDMQSAIGYNCGNDSSAENTGSTDSMPYHTGTVQNSLDTYGAGVQYRYIEDPWGNVGEWCDGWRAEENAAGDGSWDVYITLNPAEFSDESGGVLVGTIDAETAAGSFIKNWTIPSVSGYDWALIPSGDWEDIETGFEFVADYCVVVGPALYVGGFWGQYPFCGPFLLFSDPASAASSVVGARFQKIP